MADFKAHKVVSSLPPTLTANTLYVVRVGDGFDLYMTNSIGTIVAYKVNEGTLLDIAILTASTTFDSTTKSGRDVFINHTGGTSIPITFDSSIPIGWYTVLTQMDTGIFNIILPASNTIIERDGRGRQTVNKLDRVQIKKIATDTWVIDGDFNEV